MRPEPLVHQFLRRIIRVTNTLDDNKVELYIIGPLHQKP